MKSPTHGARADEKGGIRERILAAALVTLREDGVQGLSQVQVARRAKVRQSHLTYYFAKRHDLIEAVATRVLEGIVQDLDDAVIAGAPAGDASSLLGRLAAAIVDREHMRMFTAIIVEADGDPKVRAILVRLTLRVQSMLAAALGGSDAAKRAEVVLANLWGLGLYDFVMRPKRPGALVASYIATMTTQRKRATSKRG
jgi:AcrR family transcriptional regulator